MRTIHFLEACNNLEAVMDLAVDDHDAVLITRPDAPNVVIMSQDKYDSWVQSRPYRSPRSKSRQNESPLVRLS